MYQSMEPELGRMKVIKRNGVTEPVRFDKITERITKLCFNLDNRFIDPTVVTGKVAQGVYDNVTTSEIDGLVAETCAFLSTSHPDYSRLAGRIVASNLQKMTEDNYIKLITKMKTYVHPKTLEKCPLISDELYKIVYDNSDQIQSFMNYERDLEFDYFGFKTLEKSYLLRIDDKIVERPQHMYMRIAIGIHGNDLEKVKETYDNMSLKYFTHATPTMYNAGTPRAQMSSCFLTDIKSDSIDGIFSTLSDCAAISKNAGGIGFSISKIRATGSYISSSGGMSNGLIPMLRVFDTTARYVDQGGGKRKGAFAAYLEPWHADVFDFLNLKKNHGKEENRARDLFYALWIPDLFMKRVELEEKWSLFCPHECPGLDDVWGEEFDNLYIKYENEGKARNVIDSRKLWYAILDSQIETGTPYMLYKDSANKKSNQQNLGTIKCSNLCTEIIEYTSEKEIAVCNLASICLPSLIENNEFNFQKLKDITIIVTNNLNKVIDRNYYPVKQAKYSNEKHRPIGLGVQGLADCFIKLRYPFDSDEAAQLNKDIFETIYYGSLVASNHLAKENGPYSSFQNSPSAKGILQYDMWGVVPSSRWDWSSLKRDIAEHGLRNSLLVAPMPTASTAQIMGNNECIEPYTSNIYTRRVLSGEFPVINKHLYIDLINLGLWSHDMKNEIIAANGSVQNIKSIPNEIKELYKTAWEIKMKVLVDMAADRGAYVCQSQSFNAFMTEVDYPKLTSFHFYCWKKGLKTGMYYLRTKAAVDAIKFTLDKSELKEDVKEDVEVEVCTLQEGCVSCGA